MPRRIEQQEAIKGINNAYNYAEEQKKFAKLLYRPLLKDVRVLNISGNYLEVGAGPGLLAIMIAQSNPAINITTIDLSLDMVTVADEWVRAKKLQDRVRCLWADANDENIMHGLGKFDFVYSTFSLHHWKDPVKSISNLWRAVGDNGVLYIYDFRRVRWLSWLPLNGGDINSIKASYTPSEISSFVRNLDIENFKVKTVLPFFLKLIASKNKKSLKTQNLLTWKFFFGLL